MKIKRLPKTNCIPERINFGKNIRQAREECGLSQIELASEIGFKSATALSLIESNKRKVSAELLNRIAYITNTPITTMFNVDTI